MVEHYMYVFCDGGCRGNQTKENIGGWGSVIILGKGKCELNGSVLNTTNNIMELTACIESLKFIENKDIPVVVTSDSSYLIKGINEWLAGWKRKGWRSTTGAVKNKELWQELDKLKSEFSHISFHHCKGHADNEGNNRADELANMAMDGVIV